MVVRVWCIGEALRVRFHRMIYCLNVTTNVCPSDQCRFKSKSPLLSFCPHKFKVLVSSKVSGYISIKPEIFECFVIRTGILPFYKKQYQCWSKRYKWFLRTTVIPVRRGKPKRNNFLSYNSDRREKHREEGEKLKKIVIKTKTISSVTLASSYELV